MKRLLLFCFALLTLQTSSAQGQFAPVGAEWWHQGKDPDFIWFGFINKFWADHTIVTGDTVVNGIAARKLETTRYAKGRTSPTTVYIDEIKTSIIYDSPDTVFIFDDRRESFIPLYVYNVEEGDTVTLPVPGAYHTLAPSMDTLFSFIIDSIRVLPFDTASLKTYFTRAINNEELNMSYNWGDLTWVHEDETGPKGLHLGQYSERLGNCFIGKYSTICNLP